MITALHVSPEIFARITKALLDHEAGGGDYQGSATVGLDILYYHTSLSLDDAQRIVNSPTPVPIVIIWNWQYRSELKEEFTTL